MFVLALCFLGTTHALFYGSKGGSTKGGSSAGSVPPSPVKAHPIGKFYSFGRQYPEASAVSAPVFTSRQVEYVPVLNQGYAPQPQLITVEPHAQPVQFLFKSQSSPLQLRQVHLPSPHGQYQVTRSQELPQVIRHESYKPVVSELVETVVPYRNIVQVVKPVRENVYTVLPKAQYPQYPGFRYNQPVPPVVPQVFNSFFHKFSTKGGKPQPEPEPEEQQQQQQEEEEEEQQQEEQQPLPPPPPPPVKG